jgi:hypothetical protein
MILLSKNKIHTDPGEVYSPYVYIGSGNNSDYYLLPNSIEILVVNRYRNVGYKSYYFGEYNRFFEEKFLGEAIKLAKKLMVLL